MIVYDLPDRSGPLPTAQDPSRPLRTSQDPTIPSGLLRINQDHSELLRTAKYYTAQDCLGSLRTPQDPLFHVDLFESI